MHIELGPESLDLHRMVAVNENIKAVLRISAASQLVAINSMLIAKKSSGGRLLGFGVVSSELKVFSRKLDDAMGILGAITFDLVRKVTLHTKLVRERRHLLNTISKNQQAEAFLESTLAHKEDALDKLASLFEQDKQKLAQLLRLTVKLCKTGNALARCAKIEAAYGGEMNKVLTQIAEHIEDTVQQILATLKTVETEMEV